MGDSIQYVPLWKVEPDREQPRKIFNEEALQELANSISQYGVIEPILVEEKEGYYSIIAGERRWRAAKIAKIREIPVIIRKMTPKEKAEVALIENLHREDLGPIELARAFKKYCDEYHATQQKLSEILAIDRSSVAHTLQLLLLPEQVQEWLSDKKLTIGHGKALLSLKDPEKQIELAKEVIEQNLSVRETEKRVAKLKRSKRKSKDLPLIEMYNYQDLESQLMQKTGSKVTIQRDRVKGSITIEFYSDDELERLYEHLLTMDSQ